MKKSTLKNIIKEAIDNMELSLELSNGKIIHGLARKRPKALSLQIGNNNYFSFWEGKFSSGGIKIVGGVDDRSHGWFLKATEEYLEAMHDAYPERFGPLQEDNEYQEVEKQMFDLKSAGKRNTPEYDKLIKRRAELEKAKMNGERNPYSGFLSTDDTKTVIVRSNEDWEKLANSLSSKGFKHQGSLNPLNPNKGLTQMSNYAKFPYEVVINKTEKLVDFGEHTLSSDIK